LNVRYTVKGGTLYAIILGNWPPGGEVVIPSLAVGRVGGGRITEVALLGGAGKLAFAHDAAGLKVTLPSAAPCKYAYVLEIAGLKMNPSPNTCDGNPQ